MPDKHTRKKERDKRDLPPASVCIDAVAKLDVCPPPKAEGPAVANRDRDGCGHEEEEHTPHQAAHVSADKGTAEVGLDHGAPTDGCAGVDADLKRY